MYAEESKLNQAYERIMEKVNITKQDYKRVNRATLNIGTQVEFEHTDSSSKASIIAMQHIKEHPSVDTPNELDSLYYNKLAELEKELESVEPRRGVEPGFTGGEKAE